MSSNDVTNRCSRSNSDGGPGQQQQQQLCQPPRKRKPRILLGITGSVAAIKGPELALRLSSFLGSGADVRILLTRGGENFWYKSSQYNETIWEQTQQRIIQTKQLPQEEKLKDKKDTTAASSANAAENDDSEEKEIGTIQIHDASEEWKNWNKIGDSVLHIQLRDWADILIIAPLSAHTLAKLATGLCDDTLSCVVRAWDFGYNPHRAGKPLLLAPAMNTAMWQHPITKSQLTILQNFWNKNTNANATTNGSTSADDDDCGGVKIIEPQVKILACGEIGNGAMASVDDIILAVQESLKASN